MSIDVEGLKSRYTMDEVVARYVDLKPDGREFKGLCPVHADKRPSFYVVPERGFCHCFACGFNAHDIIDFVKQVEGVEFQAACVILGADDLPDRRESRARIAAPDKTAEWTPIVPVPAGAAAMDPATIWNPKRSAAWKMRPVTTDTYRDADGNLYGYVLRVEFNGTKITPQVTYCRSVTGEERWCATGMPAPRPMLGAELLSGRPEAKVLIVEGEKARRAAEALLACFVCLSWAGGSNGVSKTDWTPLRGRNVLVMPDADEPGYAAAVVIEARAHAAGAKVVRHLDTRGQPEGWDIADFEGTGADFATWASSRVTVIDPPPIVSEDERIALNAEYSDAQEETMDSRGTWSGTEAQLAYEESLDEARGDGPEISGDEDNDPVDLLSMIRPAGLKREYLPKILGDYVWDKAELIGVDPAVVALGCIVSCASVITDEIKIQSKRLDTDWSEEARLWGAIVGDPSMKKTPALSAGTRPVYKMSDELANQSDIAMLKYNDEMERWNSGKAKRKKLMNSDVPIDLDIGKAPVKPARRQIVVEDITIEALADTLKDNPRGVLALHDELATWFGQMDAYKANAGAERSKWLSMYQGGPKRVQRVGREIGKVPNWSACILGGIQPSALRNIAGKGTVDDGLMQRFMFVIADPSYSTAKEVDRTPDHEATAAYANLITGLYNLEKTEFPIMFTPEAADVRDEMYEFGFTMQTLEVLPEQMRTAIGKWSGLFPRLALTFHCIECVEAGRPIHKPVHAGTAKRAAAFMRRFLIQHLYAVYTDLLSADNDFAHAKWIAGYILSREIDVLTSRDLARSYPSYRSMSTWQREKITLLMTEMGWLKVANTNLHPGKKATRWTVNPRVHERFKGHAEVEKNRRRKTLKAMNAAREYVPGLRSGAGIHFSDEEE